MLTKNLCLDRKKVSTCGILAIAYKPIIGGGGSPPARAPSPGTFSLRMLSEVPLGVSLALGER